MQPQKRFYRPDEVAAAFEEPLGKIYRWIREGRIEAIRLGGRWKISADEFNCVMKFGTRLILL
jgi:excisionase family DNA binding protein